ncbi:MAG: hypothetical protein GH143_08960 [Calditrichaeota bacterium]|nr:hypothetical protein [Calditrichota bacterium]
MTADVAGGHAGKDRLTLPIEQPHPQEMDGVAPALNIGLAVDPPLPLTSTSPSAI